MIHHTIRLQPLLCIAVSLSFWNAKGLMGEKWGKIIIMKYYSHEYHKYYIHTNIVLSLCSRVLGHFWGNFVTENVEDYIVSSCSGYVTFLQTMLFPVLLQLTHCPDGFSQCDFWIKFRHSRPFVQPSERSTVWPFAVPCSALSCIWKAHWHTEELKPLKWYCVVLTAFHVSWIPTVHPHGSPLTGRFEVQHHGCFNS